MNILKRIQWRWRFYWAKRYYMRMSPEDREEMFRQQRESWARSCSSHGPRRSRVVKD